MSCVKLKSVPLATDSGRAAGFSTHLALLALASPSNSAIQKREHDDVVHVRLASGLLGRHRNSDSRLSQRGFLIKPTVNQKDNHISFMRGGLEYAIKPRHDQLPRLGRRELTSFAPLPAHRHIPPSLHLVYIWLGKRPFVERSRLPRSNLFTSGAPCLK